MSLSSRRAWIEIPWSKAIETVENLSLSSRRAWIEIFIFVRISAEGFGRSPHGERGLKYGYGQASW